MHVVVQAPVGGAMQVILPQGSADCPCIDPHPLVGPGTRNETCSGIQKGGICYQREYGSTGCRQYDAVAADECQAVDRPARWVRLLLCVTCCPALPCRTPARHEHMLSGRVLSVDTHWDLTLEHAHTRTRTRTHT